MPPELRSKLRSEGTSVNQHLKTAALVLLCAVIGLLGGLWFSENEETAGTAPEIELSVLGIACILGGVVLVVLLALAAHEAGHLLGGWISDFQFQLFAVGPFMLSRTADGIKAAFHTHWSLYGGVALSVPRDLRDLSRREVWMVAGGPVMSLLLGGLAMGAYAVYTASGVPLTFEQPAAWLTLNGLAFFGGCSLIIGLATLVPGTTGGFYTDGMRLLRMWRNHPAARRDTAVFALAVLQFAERPRDWNLELVEQACAVDDGTFYDVEGRRLAYLHALDTCDVERAYRLLQEALDRHALYPSAAQSLLTMEAAFFEGAIRHDADAAARWMAASTDGGLLDESTHLRAKVAVRWAAGQSVTDVLTEAHNAVADCPERGLAAAVHDWLSPLTRPLPESDSAVH